LDTNGSNPQVLKGIIEAHLADYFAMDIKSSPENYAKAAGTVVDMEQIRESIEVIKASGMLYEFRTTALKPFITQEDMAGIVRLIGAGQPYHLKKGIVTNKILDTRLADLPEYTDEEWEKIMGVLR